MAKNRRNPAAKTLEKPQHRPKMVPDKRQKIREKAKEELASGFTCECGVYHKYPAYVYAHWREELVHSCDCGRKHNICVGYAQLIA
jgi:hypothetical protein